VSSALSPSAPADLDAITAYLRTLRPIKTPGF